MNDALSTILNPPAWNGWPPDLASPRDRCGTLMAFCISSTFGAASSHAGNRGKGSTWGGNTGEGNGLTSDRRGRLIMCEGANRRVSRTEAGGSVVPLVDRWQGKRPNRPNDVVCHSDGSLYFTDPGMQVPPEERDLDSSPAFAWHPAVPFRSPPPGANIPMASPFRPMNARYTLPIPARACSSMPSMSSPTGA
jgi:hypothetical protein